MILPLAAPSRQQRQRRIPNMRFVDSAGPDFSNRPRPLWGRATATARTLGELLIPKVVMAMAVLLFLAFTSYYYQDVVPTTTATSKVSAELWDSASTGSIQSRVIKPYNFLPKEPHWNPNLTHTDTTRCQRTLLLPFRVGCPASCVNHRRGVANNDEPMYRMSIAWYLGQSSSYDPSKPKAQVGTVYDEGRNYQCPLEFVDAFSKANRTLVEEVLARGASRDTITTALQAKFQARMHLSLMYLCCLRASETGLVRESMYQWVMDRYPFNFTVRFVELQCWHERFNSVTNIIVADHESQRILSGIYQDLADRLEHDLGFPVADSVPHWDQMPFHVTLVGFHYGNEEGNSSRDDIRPVLPMIHERVQALSEKMRDTWTGRSAMRITHEPRFYTKGKLHNFPVPLYE